MQPYKSFGSCHTHTHTELMPEGISNKLARASSTSTPPLLNIYLNIPKSSAHLQRMYSKEQTALTCSCHPICACWSHSTSVLEKLIVLWPIERKVWFHISVKTVTGQTDQNVHWYHTQISSCLETVFVSDRYLVATWSLNNGSSTGS